MQAVGRANHQPITESEKGKILKKMRHYCREGRQRVWSRDRQYRFFLKKKIRVNLRWAASRARPSRLRKEARRSGQPSPRLVEGSLSAPSQRGFFLLDNTRSRELLTKWIPGYSMGQPSHQTLQILPFVQPTRREKPSGASFAIGQLQLYPGCENLVINSSKRSLVATDWFVTI